MIPDIEAAMVEFLGDHPEVVAIAGANRVSTELPTDPDLPRVRVSLTGGGVAVEGWLYSPRVTLEAWADDKATAFNLARTVLHVVETDLVAAQVSQGVVTGAQNDAGLLWAPDPDTQKARYVGSVTVYIHPNT